MAESATRPAAEIGAAALWYEPGQKISFGQVVKSLPSTLNCFRWGIGRVLRLLSATEKAHPEEPHYDLFAVGVRQESQGRGLGSEVIRPMLRRPR